MIFDIFKKKKYYSCDFLNNELGFFTGRIAGCCSGYDGVDYAKITSPDDKVSWNEILKIKKDSIRLLEKGIIPEGCKNCYKIKPYEKAKNYKFNRIILNYYQQCNCGCIYCSQREDTKGEIVLEKRPSKFYNLMPHVKELYKKNLLDVEDLIVDFQGGDLSVLDEFEPLIEEFLKNGVKSFVFATNNIIYQPMIAKALNQTQGMFVTSLDCGSEDMYKKIKRVDKFNDVIENLRRYKEEITNPSVSIMVKYIIVQNLNDNVEEIEKFINCMKQLQIKTIQLEINYHDVLMCKDKKFVLPKHYKGLFEFAEKKCKESEINFTIWEHTRKVLEKGEFNEVGD